MKFIKNTILIIIFTLLVTFFVVPTIFISVGQYYASSEEVQQTKKEYLKIMKP